jgi:hypothetical protein
MAPKMTASAALAAARASSVRGSPWASMEAWRREEWVSGFRRGIQEGSSGTYTSKRVFFDVEVDVGAALVDDMEQLERLCRHLARR